MQKQPPNLLKSTLATLRELSLKEKTLLLLRTFISLASFLTCFLGLITVLPLKIANPLALFFLSIALFLSALYDVKSRRVTFVLYVVISAALMLTSIGLFAAYYTLDV